MNAPHLDLPIAPVADAVVGAFDTAARSAGSLGGSAAALISDHMTDQLVAVVEDAVGRTRRLDARVVLGALGIVVALGAVIVLLRRHRRQVQQHDAADAQDG
jgi:hypothetical protein